MKRVSLVAKCVVFSLFMLSVAKLPAQEPSFGFQRLGESYDPVFALTTDSGGYVWAGTTHGLTRYDSHSSVTYMHDEDDPSSLCHNTVNVLLPVDVRGEAMLVGTNRGLALYRPDTDRFEQIAPCRDNHVRALLVHNDSLWVGSSSGLVLLTGFRDGFGGCSARRMVEGRHIACCCEADGELWFGSYNKIYKRCADGTVAELHIPILERWHNNLVCDIIAAGDGSMLLATECGLLRFDPGSGDAEVLLADVPVRCFMRSSGGVLWVGTDNGVYLFGRDGLQGHICHESGNVTTISDNVISHIHEDGRGNVWVATDHGVCMTMQNNFYSFVRLKSITGSDDGLAIRTICKDREGALWLGGKNGLVRKGRDSTSWFKADEGVGSHRILHNKVRSLYADENGVWVASDGGLELYEYSTRRFRRFAVTEPTGNYSSSWMYGICEDGRGRLWLSTYEGGIFVVDKRRLLASGGNYCADMHFSTEDEGVPSNIASKIVISGNRCFVITDEGLVAIHTNTSEVEPVPLPKGVVAQSLGSCDDKVYIGTSSGLYEWWRDSVREIPGPRLPIWVVVADGGRVWTVSDAVVSVYDTVAGEAVHNKVGNMPMLCALVDGNRIYAGTTDGYNIISRDDFSRGKPSMRTRITGLNINNHKIGVGEQVGGDVLLERNVDITERLVLPHNRNSFTLEFSDFDFSLSEHRYAYRLNGLNDEWQFTEKGSNHATFINLPTGSYTFEVGAITADGEIQSDVARLHIKIRPHWYASPLAFVFYALLAAVVMVAVYMAVRTRRQLAYEREQRDEALKMVKMKSDFLANLAHEFKTPLSIILGHVGKLISTEADEIHSRELVSMQRNAEKMHLLIDRMVAGNESDDAALFIPSATSIVELVRKVYDEFLPAFEEKGVSTRFYGDDIRYIFMLDRVKIESALGNLLSNALKFTPAGGSVLVSVTASTETDDLMYADITVEDTGVGIREEELPYVFNQYYRAISNQEYNIHGSGIGLYIVKSVAELHKGSVSVTSRAGEGSRFTLRFSTMKSESFVMKDEGEDENMSLHNLSKVWNHERKPIILLVEDNRDIRDFITVSLGDDYTFVCAENGRQGLELLAGNKIDLVITDIMMPVMDGIAMSRKIRRSLATAFLPIIILTGRNDRTTELDAYEFADAFIPKPFSLKYLNNRIVLLLIKHEQYLEKMRQEQMMTADVAEVRNPDEVFMQEITDIINSHIDDDQFSASKLVELSRYSSKQVYRKIKQLNGMGVVEFIREVRLRKAALYLKQDKLTVTEVMYMVGFTTPSYFGKCFKARFGVSPSEYASSVETSPRRPSDE